MSMPVSYHLIEHCVRRKRARCSRLITSSSMGERDEDIEEEEEEEEEEEIDEEEEEEEDVFDEYVGRIFDRLAA